MQDLSTLSPNSWMATTVWHGSITAPQDRALHSASHSPHLATPGLLPGLCRWVTFCRPWEDPSPVHLGQGQRAWEDAGALGLLWPFIGLNMFQDTLCDKFFQEMHKAEDKERHQIYSLPDYTSYRPLTNPGWGSGPQWEGSVWRCDNLGGLYRDYT